MESISRAALILSIAMPLALACSSGAPAAPKPAPAPPAQATTALPAAVPTAPPTPAPPPTPRPPEIVRVGHTAGLGNVFQVAAARGYYQEQGIELDRVPFVSTAEIVVPLSTGELDVGSSTPNASFFNALARGVRLNLALDAGHVPAGGRYFPLVSRLTPTGPVVTDVASLRGKRIGQNQRGVINEWALDRALTEAGMQFDDVEILVMPFPDIVAGFGGGSVDAGILPEPFGTIGEERGLAARVRDMDDYIAGGQVAAMAYSERLVRERPDAARRFAVAYLRGARELVDAMELGRDREAMIQILAQAANIDPRVVEKAGFAGIRRDGRVNLQSLEAMLDWLVQRGYVSQRPNLTQLVDTQFADYASQTLDRPR